MPLKIFFLLFDNIVLTEALTADNTLPWEGGISPGRMNMRDDATDR